MRADLNGLVSFLIGGGGTATVGAGGEASAGGLVDHTGNASTFLTFGPSLGFNVSGDLFAGFFSGNVCDFSGRFVNYNLVFRYASFTLMVGKGSFGLTVGLGPAALSTGASVSVTETVLGPK